MIVVDVGGEELDVAPAGLVAAGIGDERRHYIGAARGPGQCRGDRRFGDGRKMVVGGVSKP